MGSWKGRGNQYIQFVRVLYCKLLTNSKQLPAFPLEAMPGTEPQPQRWEARVLPLCHCGPYIYQKYIDHNEWEVISGLVQVWHLITGCQLCVGLTPTNDNAEYLSQYDIGYLMGCKTLTLT